MLKLNESYLADPTAFNQTELLKAIKLLTDNPDFNTEESMMLVDKILSETLEMKNPTKILTEEQSQISSEILDNMLGYMDAHCGRD